MSYKSSSSDSSSNGSNITRFALDGVVAEMVVEVDDNQELLLSPNKALKLNGLDNCEKLNSSALKNSFVALDPILKMDDVNISDIEIQEQKDSMQEETMEEFHENQTFLKSNILDVQEVSMNEKCDFSNVKGSDISNEDRGSQPVEKLQKDVAKIDVDEVTEKNKWELLKQDEGKSLIEEAPKTIETELPEEDENKSTVEDATKTVEAESLNKDENKSIFTDATENIQTSQKKCENNTIVEEFIETDRAEMSKNNENETAVEMIKINEAEPSEVSNKSGVEEMTETNEDQLIEKVENKSPVDEIIETQLSEKDEKESLVDGMTKTNDAQLTEKDEKKSVEANEAQKFKENKSKLEVEMTTTNDTEPEKDESKSVGKEVTDKSVVQLSEKNEKLSLDRLTETVVVGCESTELELLECKAQSGMKRSSKLPLNKIKAWEHEKTDDNDEKEPKTRSLRTRPSEKEKKEVKNITAKKRKDISTKSIYVPVKKAKNMKEEISKRGSKRVLHEEHTTEGTGKRLRSATQENPKIHRRSQVSSSSKTLETKNKKPELREKKREITSTKPETRNQKPETSIKKPETRNKKLETKNEKPEIKNKTQEIKDKKPEMKRHSLRKTTLQKSATIISSKPKVYNLNRGTATNLGIFSEVKEKVNESDMKYLRYLYRILYDQWPPKDIDELKEEILKFEGYNFKKKSQDLQKREQVLKKMPDASVVEICKILDLKVDSKENMISDIIKFLLKPVKIVISTVDPFNPSMQPIVKLKRISIDGYLNKSAKKENKTPVPVKRSKRERYPSTKLEIYVADIPDKPSVSSIKDEQKKLQPEIKTDTGTKDESSKNTIFKQSTINKTRSDEKSSVKRNQKSLAAKYVKKKKNTIFGRYRKRKVAYNQNARKKLMKLAVKIQETKSPVKNMDTSEISETEIKLEPVVEEIQDVEELNEIKKSGVVKSSKSLTKQIVHETSRSRDSSSEATLSSDEAKQMTKADSPRKRVSHIRVGKPLRIFTKIKENILNANFSALQRLHILLFGASDKADNLKGNILAFGGFPFLEGSEEWKQKEFLLSLLAQNTLREYLNLLCIEYTDDDQKTLISKLMRFLAAPSEKPIDDEIRTQVISSEPVSCAPVHSPKVPIKRKKKKTEEKKPRPRKILMDEAQVKRLEADLAREQRILEREKKLHAEQAKKVQAKATAILEISKKTQPFMIKDGMESDESLEKKAALTVKQTDAELLNALLQTVYKRRALKKAGVVISAPKKETLTRLGELANVKFLVVTANYSDLDILHHLIYMTEANRGKVRKNILDFAGFNFAEDSQTYKDRMEFLNSLGYDISKRIAFLLGLCPFKTEIEQQDLNELIMYFLMHPCKSKQIPIRHLPQTFFRKDIPKEICQLMQKHLVELPASTEIPSTSEVESSSKQQPEITVIEDESSTSLPIRQKAKKSFKSSYLPSVHRKGLSPSISTLPLSAPKPLLKPLKSSQPVLLSGSNNKIFLPALGHSPQPTLQKAIFKPSLPSITIPSTSNAPQEVLIQQQTPDGQQKTFKLIKLPTTTTQSVQSTVQSVLKNAAPLTIPASVPPVMQSKPLPFNQPVQVSPVISGSLPPGLIFFKSSPPVAVNQSLPNIIQTVPVMLNTPAMNISPIVSVANTNQETVAVREEETSDIPVECEYTEDSVEELNPLADSSPPTDEDLYNSIQEIIHSSDFENITLKNVIDRVSAQYSTFDLIDRHMYMKECIKKIIMGT